MSSLTAFADWLRQSLALEPEPLGLDPAPGSINGAYHRRFVRALAQDSAGLQALGPADFVTLLRSAIRRELWSGLEVALEVSLDLVRRLRIEQHHWSRASLAALPIRSG